MHQKCFPLLIVAINSFQVSCLADDILKNIEFDALRVVFNKFQSVVQFLPTVTTILSPEVKSLSFTLACVIFVLGFHVSVLSVLFSV